MIKNIRQLTFLLFILLYFVSVWTVSAQQKKSTNTKTANSSKNKGSNKVSEQHLISKEELDDYKKRVASLVSFLQFALNTVGSDSTDPEDKEIIISRSYLKFFTSNKVQVEDDLDEHRLVKTYKPIQSYLQDVDFFFKHVQFELNIEEIIPFFDNVENPYFKVGLTRYIKGKSTNGDTIFNGKKRYIEINVDLKKKDIKIASIYTTPLNEEDDQLTWWNGLNADWKTIFKKEMGGLDTLNLGQIKRLQITQELNLSGNNSILDLYPLNRLGALKILNLSNINIYDLMPLRNLSNLEYLNLDGTLIKNFSDLKYATNLKELSFNNTKLDSTIDISKFTKLEKIFFSKSGIADLSFLKNALALKYIEANNNSIKNLSPLGKLIALEQLNISFNPVSDIEPIGKLPQLQLLNLSSTLIAHINVLEDLKNLKKLYINNTKVQTLAPINSSTQIEKIYCDNTEISKEESMQFINTHPGTLVIFESGHLLSWWQSLPEYWKLIFRKYVKMDTTPSLDQLARLVNETEIDITDNKEVSTLEPLKAFYNLKLLKIKSTGVSNLDPIKDCVHLETLDITDTKIASLSPINNIRNIKKIYCEKTSLDSSAINTFRDLRRNCIVIYRTKSLRNWWIDVPDAWRSVFSKYVHFDKSPTDEELHTIIGLDSLTVIDNSATSSLVPIQKMDRIKKLSLINCRISDLLPLQNSFTLVHLDLSKNPVKDLTPLTKLVDLTKLILENTGVSDLEVLAALPNVEVLNLAGTQVKELDDIEKYVNLKQLDISSTSISSLKPIENNLSLRLLNCYNTKISEKKVAKYKTQNPKCEVVFY